MQKRYDKKMNNKKPPELHLIDGTKGLNQGMLLPEKIKKRIPKADWLDNPDLWDRDTFIKETSDFMYDVYGIGSDQDKHSLSLLADTITDFIKCTKKINESSMVLVTNNNKTIMPNPYVSIKQKCLRDIFMIMNELGLTPRSRLSSNKVEDDSAVAQFLRGPFAK
jgi:phage terminase small subunit